MWITGRQLLVRDEDLDQCEQKAPELLNEVQLGHTKPSILEAFD